MRTLTELIYQEYKHIEQTGVITDRAKFLGKLFRFREFGRCPVCDNRGITRYDHPATMIIRFDCHTCHTWAEITPLDIRNLAWCDEVSFMTLVAEKMIGNHSENPTG